MRVPYTRHRSKISDQTKKQVVALYKNGTKIVDIAHAVGISEWSVRQILKKASIPLRKKEPWTARDQDEAEKLFKAGYSAWEISKKMGRNYATIRKYLGLSPQTQENDESEEEQPWYDLNKKEYTFSVGDIYIVRLWKESTSKLRYLGKFGKHHMFEALAKEPWKTCFTNNQLIDLYIELA